MSLDTFGKSEYVLIIPLLSFDYLVILVRSAVKSLLRITTAGVSKHLLCTQYLLSLEGFCFRDSCALPKSLTELKASAPDFIIKVTLLAVEYTVIYYQSVEIY